MAQVARKETTVGNGHRSPAAGRVGSAVRRPRARRPVTPRTPRAVAPVPAEPAPADVRPEPRRPAWADPDLPSIRADDRVSPKGPTYFEKAVEDHGRRLLGIARGIVGYRASGEDVVQQALTNLYRHRDRYDWRQPGPLLKRATVNEALRLLRPPRMTAFADDSAGRDARNNRDRGTAPDQPLEQAETVERVREAIDELPEHFRAALVLCEYEGMSYQQISETLGCSIPQVKTWLHRARRKLAGRLESFVEGRRADEQE